jgi:CDP-diacylglycerol--glycerol-3-phosphate 3-phosphatidyltransferase
MSFIRYGRISSFHTYLAKLAAILQGTFLILIFFLDDWPLTLFHVAAIVTILDLFEEIILVIILPKWESDVKGLYWRKRTN